MVQTTPVLFIAVIFEYRYLLRRTSVDDFAFTSSRVVRVWTGISSLVVSALLLVTFWLGVDGLRSGTATHSVSGRVAAGALLSAAIIAIGTPALLLFVNATHDVWTLLARRVPWSRFSRLQLQVIRSREEALAAARRSRDVRLSMLMKMSEALVLAGEANRMTRMLPSPALEAATKARDDLYLIAAQLTEAMEVFDAAAPPAVQQTAVFTGLSESEVSYMRAELARESERTA
ncbi:hypothetical protein [Microbacterium sp. NPDC090003]|uniref:hypothetical protein n=1 Tax=Microbacterium sp. NPDC090003 TaxID=3364203 RepID=UPI003830782C